MATPKNFFINRINQYGIGCSYQKPSRADRYRGHKGYISIGISESPHFASTRAQLTVGEAAQLIEMLSRAIMDYQQANG